MPLRTILRISPAAWLFPAVVVIAIAISNTIIAPPEPYPPALTGAGEFSIVLVAPICAALAAWEAGRLRRAHWWNLPHVRPSLYIALSAVIAPLCVGWTTIMISIAFRLLSRGVLIPDLRILLVAIVVILAQTLIGFTAGIWLPPVIAAPAVLIVLFSWMTLPPGLNAFWVRHLTGDLSGCCSVDTDLAPGAMEGTIFLALGFMLAALIILNPRRRIIILLTSLLPAIIGLALGASLVQGMGPDPLVPRNPKYLVCSNQWPKVCVWPEHKSRLLEVSEIARKAATAWQSMGISVPNTFSEHYSLKRGENSFGFSLEANRIIIANSLAYSMLPPTPNCPENRPWIGGDRQEYLNAWLDEVAGLTADQISNEFPSDVLQTVARVRRMSIPEQRTWYKRNFQMAQKCGSLPHLEVDK